MEATLLWTGLAFGTVMLIPVLLEFLKRNLPLCVGIAVTLFTLWALTPNSPEVRAAWAALSQVPWLLWNLVFG